jgi:hypothetical protein
VVETIHRAVGSVPVLLAGSRSTGSWHESSDYDLVVVLPLARIPRALRPLARARRQLEEMLNAPVSVNPLPIHQARRGASNLFVWKLHQEGTVLAAPGGFWIDCPAHFRVTLASAHSYLMSAVFFLLTASGAPDPVGSWPQDVLSRGVNKALLHIAQLHLLRDDHYEATLEKALEVLHDEELANLASTSTDPRSWFAVRALLLGELEGLRPSTGVWPSLVRNAQYAALSRLRGRPRWPALVRLHPVDRELCEAAILLIGAVDDDGRVRPGALANVVARVPSWVSPPRGDWRRLREGLRQERASAHPLMGL